MKQIVSYTAILSGFFIVFTILSGCASVPSATLSKTRELTVPELDGTVYVSAIQYGDKVVHLTQRDYVRVTSDAKRIAILSIQIQNTIAKKEYDLSPIVLLDGDTRIEAEGVKYFSGNSVFAADWGVRSRSLLTPVTMSGRRGGPYTVNLIYVVDIDKTIIQAELFGQVVEFDSDLVSLNVIDRFN
jgi:hypothetical protein